LVFPLFLFPLFRLPDHYHNIAIQIASSGFSSSWPPYIKPRHPIRHPHIPPVSPPQQPASCLSPCISICISIFLATKPIHEPISTSTSIRSTPSLPRTPGFSPTCVRIHTTAASHISAICFLFSLLTFLDNYRRQPPMHIITIVHSSLPMLATYNR